MDREDRPPGRSSHRWVWAVGALVVGAAAFLLHVTLGMDRPVRPGWVQRLPDGTWLRLEAVTYGTKHHFEPGFLHLASLRQRLSFLPWAPEFDESTPRPVVRFWMTRRPASGGRALGFEWWTYYAVFDEHGCRFGGDGSMTMLTTEPSSGSSATAGVGSRLPPPPPTNPAVVAYGTLQPFPRRSKEMRVRLYGEGGKAVAEFLLPNPDPGPHPTWVPRRLPQSARDGDLTIILTHFTTRPMPVPIGTASFPLVSGDARFLFVWRGRPSTEWEMSDPVLLDATGNVCSLSPCGLCIHESAWKLRAQFFRTANAAFAPSEIWTVRNVAVPREGTASRLSQAATLQGKRIELLAIAGAGAFIYRNGVPTPNRSRRVPARPVASDLAVGGTTVNGISTADLVSGRPHVALRVAPLPDDWRLTLRAVDDRGRPVSSQNWNSLGSDERYLDLDIPPGAKQVDLTFALHRARTAEFLIKPPPPPRASGTAEGAAPAVGEP